MKTKSAAQFPRGKDTTSGEVWLTRPYLWHGAWPIEVPFPRAVGTGQTLGHAGGLGGGQMQEKQNNTVDKWMGPEVRELDLNLSFACHLPTFSSESWFLI